MAKYENHWKKRKEISNKKKDKLLSSFDQFDTNDDPEFIRHPISYLMEASDDISYLTSDIEDALNLGIIHKDYLIKVIKNILIKEIRDDYKNKLVEFYKAKLDKEGLLKKEELPTSSRAPDLASMLDSIMDISVEKELFSHIKAFLIRIFILHTTKVMDKFISTYSKIHSDSCAEVILNELPVGMHLFTLDQDMKYTSEKGNFLYINTSNCKLGDRIAEFKKTIFNEYIFETDIVKNDNASSKDKISLVLKNIMPKSLSEVHCKLSYLPANYQTPVVHILNESRSDEDINRITSIYIDFLTTLTDSDVEDFIKKYKLNSQTSHP